MLRLYIILTSLILLVSLSFATNTNKENYYKKYIYNLDLLEAHMRICQFDDQLCKYSSILIKDFYPYINKMYFSIVKHESCNFKYRIGKYYRYDYGLSQVNTKLWTKQKLQKLGFDIKNTKQLIYDDKLSLKVGFVILWYNIVYGFIHGTRYRTILHYVSSYHCPSKFDKHYYRKIRKIYYTLER